MNITPDILRAELNERREDGYDVSRIANRLIAPVGQSDDGPEAEALLRLLEDTERNAGWPYREPSTLAEIKVGWPEPRAISLPRIDDLDDRLLAAWLGRCTGCMLGKPVELWSRRSVRRYLDAADAHPLRDYIPKLADSSSGLDLHPSWPTTTRGNISEVTRDDDIDFTLLGLHALETHGVDLGVTEIAAEWLDHLPINQVYTAERVALRNLVLGLSPPDTATFRNPYRQWLGAQIRADIWGYVAPGDPAAAATLAFTDASLSHVKNGIYGAIWVSALIALAFVTSDPQEAILSSLTFVPGHSRFAEAINRVLDLHSSGRSWDKAIDAIEELYAGLSPVHTINNAAVVAAALLWGDADFSTTIGLAVAGGLDTDCNGATTGSILGVMCGTAGIPAHWIDPLNDRIRSAIVGFDRSRISELAQRTSTLARSRVAGAITEV